MDRQTLAQEITQYLTEQGGLCRPPRRDGGIAALRHHGAGGAAP